jgi:riboflavin synthase
MVGIIMFTGIIEKKGKILANQSFEQSNRLSIAASFTEIQVGESIAINGVCLTVLPSEQKNLLNFDISPETLRLTTLSQLQPGQEVNLERAMSAATRFGGHYVSGHVDAKAAVDAIKPMDDYFEMELSGFELEAYLYLIPKGSITVEGVSLTINAVENGVVKLMLIPHTLAETTLGSLQVGQPVNIEFDYLTRIVAHQLQIYGKLTKGIPL